ncbi:MAG: RNA 2',3'-cyclic phosphodiesterase [Gammaproteobacteria bacterium]
MRCFLALYPDEDTRILLTAANQKLQQQLHKLPLKWTAAENLHITLRFFKDIDEQQVLPQLITKLTHALSQVTAFRVTLQRIYAFPTAHQPKLLTPLVKPFDALNSLAQIIEQQCALLNIPAEKTSYQPHMTIVRIPQRTALYFNDPLAQQSIEFRAQEVTLFRSEANAGNSVYTPLETIKLATQ